MIGDNCFEFLSRCPHTSNPEVHSPDGFWVQGGYVSMKVSLMKFCSHLCSKN
jgi:hypothetical protein